MKINKVPIKIIISKKRNNKNNNENIKYIDKRLLKIHYFKKNIFNNKPLLFCYK